MRHPFNADAGGEPDEEQVEEPPPMRDLAEAVEGPIFHRYDQMFVMLTDSESRYLEEGDLIRIGIYYYELLEPARFSDVGKCYLCRPFHAGLTDYELGRLLDESA